MEEQILTPGEYLAILKRRKWALIIPFVVVVLAATLIALLWPPSFESSATILIEQREVPAEYVTSSMTTFAEQRMQSIKQRVLTSNQLQELILKFNLYPKLRDKIGIDEIVDRMRDQITLTPVNVEIADRKSGRTGTATIAFTLSFEGDTPKQAQQVVSTITTLFLKEDLKVRTEQASSTLSFLKMEKERIREELAEYEGQLAQFKKEHVDSLPEVFQMNIQGLANTERNIEAAKESLRTLKEKKEALEEELANTPKHMEDIFAGGPRKDEDEQRLEQLKLELINLKTRFSDQYPDVQKKKEEIEKVAAKVEKKKKDKAQGIGGNFEKNPAYVTLSSRLAGIKSDINSTENRIQDLLDQAEDYKQRLAAAPGVEEKYNAILAERNTLNLKHNEMQAKMLEADVAKKLETEQKGERFTLVESAKLPEKPSKPNRLAIILIGLVLGIGAGVGLAAVMEYSDSSFLDADSLAKGTGLPVLTVVPNIETRQDRSKKRIRSGVIALVTIIATVAAVVIFDSYVMDLDVLWVKVMRNIDLMGSF
ncbi:MAG: Wzz/FepE/Etk N-terminal domain-containing protein [Desulfobacterales bacterium]|nr:Wzz/FepE/Etk N-terminal domain-containing protein [Desulfobacterales bacterium]